ncbi:RING [Musa troglodytarum]|uniref:RING n=1 Tax=Musa troglodytarum TaxID=320322 RepID=A0A9E7FPF4_9LILI|nr:RING [Musa troglodytarum]
MASSVASMHAADEWRDPGRLAAAVFGAAHSRTSFSPAHLRKVLVRQPQSTDAPSSSFSTSSPLVASTAVANSVVPNEDDRGSPVTARKRQSQILDRWGARQAREMVTTIERQAHEAEISVLTTIAQPVSARAASLLREASPEPSETCSGSAPASSSGAGDLPRSVRASSLIQMWRELEAEAGLTPKHRPASSGGNAENANAAPPDEPSGVNSDGIENANAGPPDEPPGVNSDGVEDSDASGGWESDMTTAATSEPANPPSSSNENEKGRVGSIVKMLSSGDRTRSSLAPSNHDTKPMRRESPVTTDKADSFCSTGSSSLRSRGLRGRRELEDLVARMEEERREELVALADHQCVSRFAYRGRLQSMLRLRSLRRQVTEQDHPRAPARTSESERFNRRGHRSGSRKPTPESPSSVQIQFAMDAEDSGYACSTNNRYQGTASPGDSESTPPRTNSPCSRSDDTQEASHSVDGSWDEQNVWMSNIDWRRPEDSSPSTGWQGEAAAEELESYPRRNASGWIDEPPTNSRRHRRVTRRPPFQSFSDNAEIRELLERRRVSTSLESDFCDKMNQMLLSFLHRRYENFAENDEWQRNGEHQNTEQEASVSSSLAPLHYHTLHHQESRQRNSYAPDMEAMRKLRSEVAQIHDEISELRKLVKSCMEWQATLQHSIKQDILDAIFQSSECSHACPCTMKSVISLRRHNNNNLCLAAAGSGSGSHDRGATSARKGGCCKCGEMQVDSVFYR